MVLVTLDPQALEDNTTPMIAPQTLYVELRMCFDRVQAQFTASSRLIQAALLITAYEYACGKPHAAYISAGISARMASVLGINNYNQPNLDANNKSDIGLRLNITEKQHIYWGIIMLERLVLFECPLDRLKPALDFPDPQTKLPDDLLSTKFSDDTERRASVCDISSNEVGTFGRQIQALSFLVQVLQLTEENATPVSELIKLDEKLRGFLGVLMNQSSQTHTCGANGITIRYV
ncbi:hypothetical protein N7493_003689 [Penicillium malachiteum]|uniref:Transcription factor domain-containing protein n=1 Tax=Penicillium malachiteum TaxID=1324776 RepID=A0AAD6HQ64_9EURO|nr:hypothetical protein N7493_003689 [Penicillium malachiteum]